MTISCAACGAAMSKSERGFWRWACRCTEYQRDKARADASQRRSANSVATAASIQSRRGREAGTR